MDKTININEAATVLADRRLRETFKGEIDTEYDGVIIYTDEAQEVFDELYDEFYDILYHL